MNAAPAPGLAAGTTALVTGGGGFLGREIARQLRTRGLTVRSFSRAEHADLAALGVEHIRGDLADAAAVADACCGCEVVFHVAARAGVWGSYREYYAANVAGTQNVLAACRETGVRFLVFTSSPSVVFDGRDVHGGDESLPYSRRFASHYSATKAAAEQLVLAANSASLRTVALRPHLVWGPGDNHIIPRILARARAGRLVRVGRGDNLVDTTYIENAAAAHLDAAGALMHGSGPAGRAYFITNGEPTPLWELIDRILAAAGLPPVRRRVSRWQAVAAGALLEFTYSAFRIRREPPMTRFVARELAGSHWFDISAARRDLGYIPRVTLDQGLRQLAVWLGPARPAHAEPPDRTLR